MAKILIFSVPEVTCSACIVPINALLEKQQEKLQFTRFTADACIKQLRVEIDDNTDKKLLIQQIIVLLDDAGIPCQYLDDTGTNVGEPLQESILLASDSLRDPIGNVTQPQCVSSVTTERNKNSVLPYVVKGLIGLAAGAVVMGLLFSGVGIPVIAIIVPASALTLVLGMDSYIDTVKKLVKTKSINMHTLFTFSTLTIVAVSIAHLFIPWLPIIPGAALMILGFRDMGEALKQSNKSRLNESLSFKDRATKHVKIKDQLTQVWKDISADELPLGSIIQVAAGQTIPVNGVCLNDRTMIYATILTGSTEPKWIYFGDTVYAGMVVPADIASIEMRTTSFIKNSYLAEQDERVACANLEKAPIETVADKILKYFVPAVIGLALVAGVVVGVFFPPALAIQCAVAVLASACPCALGLITPIAVKIGMAKGIENGIHFRSGKTLQAASESDTVVFDLNGTLTEGAPEVTDYDCVEGIDQNAFFNYLMLLEKNSEKAIGKAIYNYASARTNAIRLEDIPCEKFHCGIKAVIDNQEFLLGNADYLQQEGIASDFPEAEPGEQVTYLVRNRCIIGSVKTRDPLKKDAKFVIDKLKAMGKDVRICTGSEKSVAIYYANLLGIEESHVFYSADNTQDTKSKDYYITHVLRGKRVAMIGDEGNDTVAVTRSHFSIAVGENSDPQTRQQAGATIHNSSLLPVLSALVISKQTRNGIMQNLIFNFIYNTSAILIAGGVLVAIGFVLNPGIGAALMVLQVGLILLNQARIKRQKLPHIKEFNQHYHQSQQHTLYKPLCSQRDAQKKTQQQHLAALCGRT